MINYDTLEKAGEYKDGSLIWFTKKEENVVYLLMIGKDSYIGSSKNLHRRFSQHLSSLKSGKCMSKSLQNAFNSIGGFSVYILEKSQNIINSTRMPATTRTPSF